MNVNEFIEKVKNVATTYCNVTSVNFEIKKSFEDRETGYQITVFYCTVDNPDYHCNFTVCRYGKFDQESLILGVKAKCINIYNARLKIEI